MIIRRQDILQFAPEKPVCVELGVAQGVFSELVLAHCDIEHLYSIDMWAGDRGHDDKQYQEAVDRLKPYADKNTIIRSTFAEALPRFSDNFFDFIYIDGYAHTGQHGGQTLRDWWPKLKPGGLFAGDDYHPAWPHNVKAVDDFCREHNLEINIHKFENENNNFWGRHPSWYVKKVN